MTFSIKSAIFAKRFSVQVRQVSRNTATSDTSQITRFSICELLLKQSFKSPVAYRLQCFASSKLEIKKKKKLFSYEQKTAESIRLFRTRLRGVSNFDKKAKSGKNSLVLRVL